MQASRRELLRWQFDLTWALFDYHLERLKPDDFLWEPGPHCWTVRPDEEGKWIPDWADTEPDPIPVPTIGWLTWHIGWWWSEALDHAQGRAARDRSAVAWPGTGTNAIDWLRRLRNEWLGVLDRVTETDLNAIAQFPWGNDSSHSVGCMIAWVNTELMKNAAEIGQLRLLRATSSE